MTISTTPQRSVRTSSDGTFFFNGLLPHTYALQARKGALAADPVEARLQTTSEPILLVLRSTPAIEAMVLDAKDHHPLAGVLLQVEAEEGVLARTDVGGRAHLEGLTAGRYIVSASADGYASAREAVFHSARADTTTPVLLMLQRGAAVHGRAVDTEGTPVPGARIRAVCTAALAEPSPPGDEAVTDANGDWTIGALPGGTFRFAAVHPRFAPAISEPLMLDGETLHRGVIVLFQRDARLTGRIVDKLGGPASFALVEVRSAGPGVLVELRRSAFADQDGAFELRGVPCAKLLVEARNDDAVSLPEEVDLASCAGDTVLTLDVDGTISGVVMTPRGDPASEARVVAVPDNRAALSELSESKNGRVAADVTDQRGAFHLRGLAPGRYRLRASSIHSEQTASFWLSSGIAADVGETDVRMLLEAPGHLRGSVALPDGRAPESFMVTLTLSPTVTFAGTHGAFALHDVPPGKHTLTFAAPGAAPRTMDIVVAAGEEHDLGLIVLPRGRSLSGRVLDADGVPVAGAIVLAGPELLGDGNHIGSAPLQDRSDTLGQFTLHGVAESPVTILAEHPTSGRSLPVVVPINSAPASIDLQLRSVAALEGTITSQGRPVGSAAVVAAPRGSSTGRFLVTTQADGRYRFDRLSSGEVVVTAGVRASPMAQILQSVTAWVSGEGVPVDIDVQRGDCSLEVHVLEADERPVENAQVYLSTGQLAARTLAELEAVRAQAGAGQTRILTLLQGRPVLIPDLMPGPYALCAVPVRGDLGDPWVTQRIRDHAGEMPVFCTQVLVEPRGALQHAAVELPSLHP